MTTATEAILNPSLAGQDELATQLAASISGQQQAIVPGVPKLPVRLEEIVVESQRVAPLVKPAFTAGDQLQAAADKTMALTDQLVGDLQLNLDMRASQAAVSATAIVGIAEADKKIALQTETERKRTQNQLIRVADEYTSEENQQRLMDQAHTQAQDIQAMLEQREAEAAEGGVGFFLKSMLNMEIYGTPGGKQDIELQAMSNQYQATQAEIQGITTAVTNFEAANRKGEVLVNDITINAGQEKITAQATLDLSESRQQMLKDNAQTMQLLIAADRNRLGAFKAILEYENAIEQRESRALSRTFQQEQFIEQKAMNALTRVGKGLDNDRKLLENALAAGDHGLAAQLKLRVESGQASLESLIRENKEKVATASDRMSIITKQEEQIGIRNEQLAHTLEKDKTLTPTQIAKAEQDLAIGEERLAALGREATLELTLNPLRIAAAQQNARVVAQQEELNALNITIQSGTAQARQLAIREKALLEADMAETERVAIKQSAASIGTAQEALYGYKDTQEQLETAARETGVSGTRYDILEQIGNNMLNGGGLVLGETPYQSWVRYQVLTSGGATTRDLKFVGALHEVNQRLEIKYADPDLQTPRPDTPEDVAAAFNAEAKAYIKEISNIKAGDGTNPLQADPLPVLEKKAPALLDDPMYKVIQGTGQIETDPERLADIAIASIGKAVSIEQAADGLAAIYTAAGFNSTHFQYGLGAAGFEVPSGYNYIMPKPSVLTLGANISTHPMFESAQNLAVQEVFPSVDTKTAANVQKLKHMKTDRIKLNLMDRTQWMAYLVTRMADRKAKGIPVGNLSATQTPPAQAQAQAPTGGTK